MKLSKAFLRGMCFTKPATAQGHLENVIEEGLVLNTVAEAWKRVGQILNKYFNNQILENESDGKIKKDMIIEDLNNEN